MLEDFNFLHQCQMVVVWSHLIQTKQEHLSGKKKKHLTETKQEMRGFQFNSIYPQFVQRWKETRVLNRYMADNSLSEYLHHRLT